MQKRPMNEIEMMTPLSGPKGVAVAKLAERVMGTSHNEFGRIDKAMRGRKADQSSPNFQPLTFGNVANLAVFAKLQAAILQAGLAEAVGVEDEHVFADAVGWITPDLTICDACGEFPIVTRGTVVLEPQTSGRCPLCHEGLLTGATPQARPFRSWVTGAECARGTNFDTASARVALPIENPKIVEGAAWYTIHPAVADSMRTVGLVTAEDQPGYAKGEPDYERLLWFLRAGPESRRFASPDQVLIALGRPAEFGGHDHTSIRAVVGNAKEWTPGVSKPSDAELPWSPPKPVKEFKRLWDLFAYLFDESELRQFVASLPDGLTLSGAMPGSQTTLAHLAFETAQMLDRRGPLDEDLHQALVATCPNRKADIDASWEAMGKQKQP